MAVWAAKTSINGTESPKQDQTSFSRPFTTPRETSVEQIPSTKTGRDKKSYEADDGLGISGRTR